MTGNSLKQWFMDVIDVIIDLYSVWYRFSTVVVVVLSKLTNFEVLLVVLYLFLLFSYIYNIC